MLLNDRIAEGLAALAEAEVLQRIQTLKTTRVIRQISAIFDTKSLGYQSSLVAVRCDPAVAAAHALYVIDQLARGQVQLDHLDAAVEIGPVGVADHFQQPQEAAGPAAALVVVGDDVHVRREPE